VAVGVAVVLAAPPATTTTGSAPPMGDSTATGTTTGPPGSTTGTTILPPPVAVDLKAVCGNSKQACMQGVADLIGSTGVDVNALKTQGVGDVLTINRVSGIPQKFKISSKSTVKKVTENFITWEALEAGAVDGVITATWDGGVFSHVRIVYSTNCAVFPNCHRCGEFNDANGGAACYWNTKRNRCQPENQMGTFSTKAQCPATAVPTSSPTVPTSAPTRLCSNLSNKSEKCTTNDDYSRHCPVYQTWMNANCAQLCCFKSLTCANLVDTSELCKTPSYADYCNQNEWKIWMNKYCPNLCCQASTPDAAAAAKLKSPAAYYGA